jgi:hypothetical protein
MPKIPAFLHALPQDARKPSDVHGRLSVDARMIGPCFLAALSAALSGAPIGITTGGAGFRLAQADVLPVVSRPGEAQEISLTLAGP